MEKNLPLACHGESWSVNVLVGWQWWVLIRMLSEPPTTTSSPKFYCSTPPVYNARRLQFVLQCFRCPKGTYSSYSQRVLRYPFAAQYLRKSWWLGSPGRSPSGGSYGTTHAGPSRLPDSDLTWAIPLLKRTDMSWHLPKHSSESMSKELGLYHCSFFSLFLCFFFSLSLALLTGKLALKRTILAIKRPNQHKKNDRKPAALKSPKQHLTEKFY